MGRQMVFDHRRDCTGLRAQDVSQTQAPSISRDDKITEARTRLGDTGGRDESPRILS